jgi:2-keto-4-pentenoate hydratase/2-oxohepta-3-ene-1,7-dioic acid hydratase in catechol pathway
MRLLRYSTESSSARIGIGSDDGIVDVGRAAAKAGVEVPDTMHGLLADPYWREKASIVTDHAARDPDAVVDRSAATLHAPVADPEKVVCVGLNYEEHIRESDEEAPENPILFSKFPSAVAGPNDAITWDPELTSQVDFEAELAVVIGETARRVDRAGAEAAVAGYTVANDVSARDLQFSDEQWVRGKTLDTFCPLGPNLVTADELGDPHELDIWTEVNGERLQESTTGDLIFGVPELVSFCSQAFTLSPGDVILTGTPPGVGAFRDPPVYLEAGDEVEVGIEGVGTLANTCAYL